MKLILAKLLFAIQIQSGIIIPSIEPDGKKIYAIPRDCIEYAYKEEVIEYLRTGTFTYDDTLDDSVNSTEQLTTNNK
jgi:hypothetical protein